jgi:hypothetical protein
MHRSSIPTTCSRGRRRHGRAPAERSRVTAIEALRGLAPGSTIDAAIVLANDAVIARAEGDRELGRAWARR